MANTITVDTCRTDEECDLLNKVTTDSDLRVVSEAAIKTAFDLSLGIVLTVVKGIAQDTMDYKVEGTKANCLAFEQAMKVYY